MREQLLRKMGLVDGTRVLEVGCGSGALKDEMEPYGWTGLDIDLEILRVAKRMSSKRSSMAKLANADGLRLPFCAGTFGLVYAHYLLLWIADPINMIAEMKRVTAPGGWVAFFAEPDYLARIDQPEYQASLGIAQNQSLRQQGARLDAGRRLPGWMQAAGLAPRFSGVIGAEWHGAERRSPLEGITLKNDLAIVGKAGSNLLQGPQGNEWVYVPTFYAAANVA